jgi:putative transposon-encoded protein
MAEFKVNGKEMIEKNAVAIGNGAVVYVPKSWIGKKLAIIRQT